MSKAFSKTLDSRFVSCQWRLHTWSESALIRLLFYLLKCNTNHLFSTTYNMDQPLARAIAMRLWLWQHVADRRSPCEPAHALTSHADVADFASYADELCLKRRHTLPTSQACCMKPKACSYPSLILPDHHHKVVLLLLLKNKTAVH